MVPTTPGHRPAGQDQEDMVNISAAERVAVEAHLDRLARQVGDLAGRLEMLKADLRGSASPARQLGQPAASQDRRSRRGAP